MTVFFDTSAFVKRYVNETGSQQVIDICQNANALAQWWKFRQWGTTGMIQKILDLLSWV